MALITKSDGNPWANDYLNEFSGNSDAGVGNSEILIIVGSLGISGGTNYILQYAYALGLSGAKVTIGYTQGEAHDGLWHPLSHVLHFEHIGELTERIFDLAVITYWTTAYALELVRFRSVLYFAQSLETRFALNSTGPLAIQNEALIAATYKVDFPMVTVASWLQNFFSQSGTRQVWLVRNGIDKGLFPVSDAPTLGDKNRKLSVLVEGAEGVPMKAVDETLSSLGELSGIIDISHISPREPRGGPRGVNRLSPRSMDQMADVYKNIDVLVKMSRVEGMFGPPLEAFHAGATAVVSRVTGYDEYIENGVNSLTVAVDNFSRMRDAVMHLSDNREFLHELKLGAIATAKNWPSIDSTARQFVSSCAGAMRMKIDSASETRRLIEYRSIIADRFRSKRDPREGFEEYCVVEHKK